MWVISFIYLLDKHIVTWFYLLPYTSETGNQNHTRKMLKWGEWREFILLWFLSLIIRIFISYSYFSRIISCLKYYIYFDIFVYFKICQNYVKTIFYFMSKREGEFFFHFIYIILIYSCIHVMHVLFFVLYRVVSYFYYFFILCLVLSGSM